MLLRQVPGITGLFYCDAFLSSAQHRIILPKVQSVLNNIARMSGALPGPDVSSRKSKKFKPYFVKIKVPDDTMDDGAANAILKAETFTDESRGHSLTHFCGNFNLPSFGRHVVNRMAELPEFQTIFRDRIDSLKWKMTLNHYSEHDESSSSQPDRDETDSDEADRDEADRDDADRGKAYRGEAAFPWCSDITGVVTAIATLRSPGQIEFRHHSNAEEIRRIELSDGSLLLLTGPSRWNYLHRDLQSPDERISLVFAA